MPENIHLCLTDLIDQDLTSHEYFNTLPDSVRQVLLQDDEIRSFEELQQRAEALKQREKLL